MYDDNFGSWQDTHDPEVRSFYRKVQRESVWKTCEDCGREVKLRPEYGVCNSCANARERGW